MNDPTTACTCWRGFERAATLCPACAEFALRREQMSDVYAEARRARDLAERDRARAQRQPRGR